MLLLLIYNEVKAKSIARERAPTGGSCFWCSTGHRPRAGSYNRD